MLAAGALLSFSGPGIEVDLFLDICLPITSTIWLEENTWLFSLFLLFGKKNSENGPSGNGLTLLEYGRMCSYFSYFYSYFTFEHILAF